MQNRQKTNDKSTKIGQKHEEQTINVSNKSMFTERKVPFCFKRKEEPEEVMHEYLPPCNANATKSYRTKRKHNETECKCSQNGRFPSAIKERRILRKSCMNTYCLATQMPQKARE